MMNILIVITCLKPHGAEYSCLRHIKNYQNKFNLKFTLLSIIGGELESDFLRLKIPVVILKDDLRKFKLKKIYKIIFSRKYHVIHSWMYHANILGVLIHFMNQKKLITSIRQALPNYSSLKKRTIIVAFVDSLLSRLFANKITFNSKAGIQDHCKRLFYARKKSIYIPNDPYIVSYKKKKDISLKKISKKIKFLSLARDDKSKNLKYMIDLINNLNFKNYKFVLDIYGDSIKNSFSKKYYDDIRNYKNSIRFFNRKKNIEKILFDYDFYISTSLWEGYPNSLISAATSGCVTISTNAGDSWELLGENVFKLKGNLFYDKGIIISAINFFESSERNQRSKECIEFIKSNQNKLDSFLDIYFGK